MATMTVHKSVTLDRILEMVSEDNSEGFCTECGEKHATSNRTPTSAAASPAARRRCTGPSS